ncbi:MAG: chloride channel protein, partial [Bacteroidetes bacterium]
MCDLKQKSQYLFGVDSYICGTFAINRHSQLTMNNEAKSGFLRLVKAFWKRKIHWVASHTSERNYQIVVAIMIGLVSGLAAVVLKYAVAVVRDWIYGGDPTHWSVWFVFLPVLGVLLCVGYVRYVLRKPLEFGASVLIRDIAQRKFNLPRYETYAHIISSSLTVGFGGSVGLEAPIMRTGAAIGTNVASALHAGRRRKTLFLACGVAGGMAAIFNSPVAGVIFAFEVFLTGTALSSFIPLLIASATGAVVARVLYYEQLFYLPTTGWEAGTLPYYILLGIACGLLSTFMLRTITAIRTYFRKYDLQRYKTLIGGLTLGGLIFLFPPLFGEGYDTINLLLKGDYQAIASHSIFYEWCSDIRVVLLFAMAVLFTKSVAAATTLGMGGNGGSFAPSMLSGALLGFVFAMGINLLGFEQLHVEDFIAVGMGGVLSGLLKAPLTGIFLIAEITGGYLLFVPLMLVSAVSYFVSFYFEPHSLYTRRLYRQGIWIPSHEKDRQVLKNMHLRQMLETNFSVVHPDDSLKTLVNTIAHCRRNLFPVIDDEGRLAGILTLDDVRDLIFKPELYDEVLVKEIMYQPPAKLNISESMDQVMEIFEQTHAWNLPVVDE